MKKLSNLAFSLLFLAVCMAIPYILPDWASTGILFFLIILILINLVDQSQKTNEQ